MIRIRKGLNIPITGLPTQQIDSGNTVHQVAVSGIDYIGIKPAMAVAVGDEVEAGQTLFTDKKFSDIHITAPASGKVVAIHRGHKRVLESVVIECNLTKGKQFTAWSAEELSTIAREEIVEQFTSSGLWCALRTRPYSKIPDPNTVPHSIFITAMDSRPLSAAPEVIINEYSEDFSNGLKILRHLTEGKLYLCTRPGVKIPTGPTEHTTFSGPHPAGLAGTHIHFLDPVHAQKTVWHVNYQDVIAVGKLFTTGFLWQERIVSLAGPQVKNPRLVKTLLGANLDQLTAGELKAGINRIISGSVLDGRRAKGTLCYLGRYHQQVSALAEGEERAFMHYLDVGMRRFSVMPIYISKWFNRRFDMTTSTNGSPRAMVPIGSYERVMPLDILPTQLLRSLIVGDIAMAEGLGMLELDEEDLALCTFVCPGKYEYGPILRDNLTLLEQGG